jgi:hypothetical protein
VARSGHEVLQLKVAVVAMRFAVHVCAPVMN